MLNLKQQSYYCTMLVKFQYSTITSLYCIDTLQNSTVALLYCTIQYNTLHYGSRFLCYFIVRSLVIKSSWAKLETKVRLYCIDINTVQYCIDFNTVQYCIDIRTIIQFLSRFTPNFRKKILCTLPEEDQHQIQQTKIN